MSLRPVERVLEETLHDLQNEPGDASSDVESLFAERKGPAGAILNRWSSELFVKQIAYAAASVAGICTLLICAPSLIGSSPFIWGTDASTTITLHLPSGSDVRKVELDDGTVVELNAHAFIMGREKPHFVEIAAGEAFIHVANATERRPFLVQVGKSTLQVTESGTAFDVSRKRDDATQVFVVSGQVRLLGEETETDPNLSTGSPPPAGPTVLSAHQAGYATPFGLADVTTLDEKAIKERLAWRNSHIRPDP